MLAERIGRELRAALASSRITLRDVARRSEIDIIDVATALGGKRLLPTDALNAIVEALGYQLAIVPARPTARPTGTIPSVVDIAMQRLSPEQTASPAENGPYVLALELHSTLHSTAAPAGAKHEMLEFLSCAGELFQRVVLVTTCPSADCRRTTLQLVAEGSAPPWFGSVEIVRMKEVHKHMDLNVMYGLQPEQNIVFASVLNDYILARHEGEWTDGSYGTHAEAYEDRLEGLVQMIVDTYVVPAG